MNRAAVIFRPERGLRVADNLRNTGRRPYLAASSRFPGEVMATKARRRLALGGMLAGVVALGPAASAGTVEGTSPYWFQDHYLDTSDVNLAQTTALVNTSGTGTVTLPYAPIALAFDPQGSYALVATRSGVDAFVFDGQSLRPVPDTMWNLGSLSGTTGANWIMDGTAFAVSTAAQVVVYGLVPGDGYDAVQVAQTAFSGAIGVAPGPSTLPSGVLVATSTGATLVEAQGTSLTPVSGGPSGLGGNLGVAATTDGSLAATWQDEGVQLWAWDGAAYERASAWDPPVPPLSDGPVAGVAFFPQSTGQGGGFWIVTAGGQLLAYAYGPTGVSQLSGLSLSVATSPSPPGAIGSGWSANSVGVLYPDGWVYEDLATGSTFGQDSIRGLSGQTWAVYQATATLLSVPLSVGHQVDQVRIEDATCTSGQTPPNCAALPVLPPGTQAGFAVSTDGCQTWTPVTVYTNTPVPSGNSLCYRMSLWTSDPTATPVVDVVNLYEITSVTQDPAQTQVVLTH